MSYIAASQLTFNGSYAFVDMVADLQSSMIRRVKNFLRRTDEFSMLLEEEMFYQFDCDFLGVWISVRSSRPQQLLNAVQQISFPSFAPLQRHTEGALHWVRFRLR
jgi:hypothetical protein